MSLASHTHGRLGENWCLRMMIAISYSLWVGTVVTVTAETNTWEGDLKSIVVPAVDLKGVKLTEAIAWINKEMTVIVTNRMVPLISVDTNPAQFVISNLTGAQLYAPYVDELTARFKQRHLSTNEAGLIYFSACYSPVFTLVKIMASGSGTGVYLHDRGGKPYVGHPGWVLECRAYRWSAARTNGCTLIVDGDKLDVQSGVEGADLLESMFNLGDRKPWSYCMMLVPGTNVVLVLGTEWFQNRIKDSFLQP